MKTDEFRKRKKELGYTNQDIAALSGVPLGTVQKFFSGVTKNPRSDTVQAIENVLFPSSRGPMGRSVEEARGLYHDIDASRKSIPVVAETAPKYHASNQEERTADKKAKDTGRVPEGDWYTYSDYLALPDDVRVELIDGRFYEMAAPTVWHQIIIGQLYVQLQACSAGHPECLVLLSPLDVRLDSDEKTVVQPDLVMICGRERLRRAGIFGAPDFLIEIISKSSRKKDYTLKAYKYMNAGVREYWIVDYERGIVLVYDNEQDMVVRIYHMNDDIPVAISNGTCVIHMGEIEKHLEHAGYDE